MDSLDGRITLALIFTMVFSLVKVMSCICWDGGLLDSRGCASVTFVSCTLLPAVLLIIFLLFLLFLLHFHINIYLLCILKSHHNIVFLLVLSNSFLLSRNILVRISDGIEVTEKVKMRNKVTIEISVGNLVILLFDAVSLKLPCQNIMPHMNIYKVTYKNWYKRTNKMKYYS